MACTSMYISMVSVVSVIENKICWIYNMMYKTVLVTSFTWIMSNISNSKLGHLVLGFNES